MTFPIARSHGSIVIVDDSTVYLENFSAPLPEDWNVITFSSTSDFLDFMTMKEGVAKEMHWFHRSAIERFRKTGNVLTEALRFWNTFPERFSLPQVLIVDYFMPQKTGIAVLAECKTWNGGRILLTGMAEEKTVMFALNDGSIDYYIPKQSPQIVSQIKSAVIRLIPKFLNHQSALLNVWSMSLQPEQVHIINDSEMRAALDGFLQGNFEYVAVGSPFGLLALGTKGQLKWLQLETKATLEEAAELATQAGASKANASDIRDGRSITDARVSSALNLKTPLVIKPAEFAIQLPWASETIYGASFDVVGASGPAEDMCYAAWLERQPSRIEA